VCVRAYVCESVCVLGSWFALRWPSCSGLLPHRLLCGGGDAWPVLLLWLVLSYEIPVRASHAVSASHPHGTKRWTNLPPEGQ
jgi:hypothetical protein